MTTPLETHPYMKLEFPLLPPPSGAVPFFRQAMPITDPQEHIGVPQAEVARSAYDHSNALPLGRFLGTDWTQQNQPLFLGANERIVFASS